MGYPIGSGAVESANKLVVEARLKGAGMHWAPAHVNPLLALRGMACSDRWEEGWPQLVTQWRAQARASTLLHRQRRQAARAVARQAAQASAHQAATAHDAAPASMPAPTLALAPPATSLTPPLRPRTTPVRRDRTSTRRPAATHPWRRPFLARRSPTPSDPEI